MNKMSRLFLAIMAVTTMLLSACGGAAVSQAETSSGGIKALASLVGISGYIEAIDGNQWTINGQIVTVDLKSLRNDDSLGDQSVFEVGDYVEIEAEIQEDGSLVAQNLDSSDDGNENDDSNSNADDDSNSNDDDDSNSNDDDDSNSNDDDDSNDNDDDSNSNDDDDSNDNNDDSDDDNENDD